MPRTWNRTLSIALAGLGLLASGLQAQSARSRAMGGAFLADLLASTDHTYGNPAGLSQVDRTEVQVGGTVSDRDMARYDHAAFTGLIYESASERKVTLEDYLESDYEFKSEPEKVSNYTYGLSYSQERRFPELSEAKGLGPLDDRSLSLRGSVATRFPIAERLTSRPELYAGARVRYADRKRTNRVIGSSAESDLWNLDLGALYKASERLTFGGLGRAILSTSMDDSPGAQEESTSFDIGTAYVLGERRDTTVNLDFRNVFNAKRAVPSEVRLGVERRFLDNDFALRMGSYDGVVTLGFGVKFFEDFKMDYSYSNFAASPEHHLSFQLPLNF